MFSAEGSIFTSKNLLLKRNRFFLRIKDIAFSSQCTSLYPFFSVSWDIRILNTLRAVQIGCSHKILRSGKGGVIRGKVNPTSIRKSHYQNMNFVNKCIFYWTFPLEQTGSGSIFSVLESPGKIFYKVIISHWYQTGDKEKHRSSSCSIIKVKFTYHPHGIRANPQANCKIV